MRERTSVENSGMSSAATSLATIVLRDIAGTSSSRSIVPPPTFRNDTRIGAGVSFGFPIAISVVKKPPIAPSDSR